VGRTDLAAATRHWRRVLGRSWYAFPAICLGRNGSLDSTTIP
jgi:hypothetical protein